MKQRFGYAYGAFYALLLIVGAYLAEADFWWWVVAIVVAAVIGTGLRYWEYSDRTSSDARPGGES